jgi:hypothetical protein
LSKCQFTFWSSNIDCGSCDWGCCSYWSGNFFCWGSSNGLLITLSHFLKFLWRHVLHLLLSHQHSLLLFGITALVGNISSLLDVFSTTLLLGESFLDDFLLLLGGKDLSLKASSSWFFFLSQSGVG